MSDRNWKSYVREDKPDLSGFTNPPDPQNYADTLKFSYCTNVDVVNLAIEGGTENCVDAVRGSNYHVTGCHLTCHGAAAVVFKGAIKSWQVISTLITPHGPTDIEVGQFDNYWYPGRAGTTLGLVQGTRTTNGAAVRVQCWDADKPDVDENVVVTKIPWIVWFPYFCFQFLWLRLNGTIPWVWKYDPPQTPTKNGVPQ